jgi:tetratricopeptide (TPR) repeat protein
MRQARTAADRRDYAAVKQICAEVLTIDPDHAEALLLRAQLAVVQNDSELALQTLARIGEAPSWIALQARYGEGSVLIGLGRAREAEAALLRALELEPRASEVEKKLRDLYMLQLRREEFRSLLRARRERQPWTLADLLDFMVAGHIPKLHMQDWAQSVNTFVDHDPHDAESRIALAAYFAAASQFKESEEMARSVLLADRTSARARALLADALMGQDKPWDAQAVLHDARPQDRAHPQVQRSLGRLALTLGNVAAALEHLRYSLQIDPGDPTALYLLGLARQRAGVTGQEVDLVVLARRMHNLLDVAHHIVSEASKATDPTTILEQIRQLAELMVAAELYEDAVYCLEFLMHKQHTNQAITALHDKARNEFDRRTNERIASMPPNPSGSAAIPATSPATNNLNRTDADPALRFEDVASHVGVAFSYFTGNTGKKYLFETLGGGVAAFDFDCDGWPDLYFSQGSRFPRDTSDFSYRDQLYRNRNGKAFESATRSAGLGDFEYTIGCTAGDYDNDGFMDLFISNYGRLRVYRNNGDGSFSDVSQATGTASAGMNTSLALADLDRDGDLDLYVVKYLTDISVCKDRSGKILVCHPATFQGDQDLMFENLGASVFQDVTSSCGVEVPDSKGLGAVIADLDNDGWPDVYISNDTTPNLLFHNQSSTQPALPETSMHFKESGLLSGTALSRDGRAQAGMGIACDDFDSNGCLDLYVTNFYLETNSLYLNQGKLSFVASTRPECLVAATGPLLGFGTQAIDADLDGRPDLFVTNGHIDDFREQDSHVMWKMPSKLYRNLGGLHFADVSAAAGAFFSGNFLGRGVARLDWNRDTRPDLVAVHQNEPVALLQNLTETAAHRVVIECVGTASNRDAINIRLRLAAGGKKRLFECMGGDGYLALNERRQIIGMGETDRIDALEVHWPSGRHDLWPDLPADVVLRLSEGQPPKIEPIAIDR